MTTQAQTPVKEKRRRGRPPRVSGRETRLNLLRSAAKEFSRAEHSEVSLEAIANNVGLTSTAIYNHFSSKDDLFFATIIHMMETNVKAIEAAVQAAGDWRSKLLAVLDLIRTDQTGWFRYPLLISAAQLKIHQDPHRFAEILRLREAYISHFVEIVECRLAAGDLPRSVSTKPTAELLMAFLFNGLGTAMSHHKDEEEISQLIDGFNAMLGLGPT